MGWHLDLAILEVLEVFSNRNDSMILWLTAIKKISAASWVNIGMTDMQKHGHKTYGNIQNSAHIHPVVDAEHPADMDAVYPTLP